MKSRVIEKLNKKLHDRANFSCGVEVLDEYIKTRANKEQENNLNVTYVATIHESINGFLKPIAGYYTLSNSSLKLDIVPTFLQKGVPPTYEIPAILIGRLAVDQHYRNQGMGKFLLTNAFQKIIETVAITGIKCVVVTAKNDGLVGFYQKYGFTALSDSKQLVLATDTLLKAVKD